MTHRSSPERPRAIPPSSTFERFLDAVSLSGLLVLVGSVAFYWGRLPESIPLHFDFGGHPDRWGDRNAIILVPLVGVLLFALLSFVARIPHLYNYPWPITPENAPRQYALARTLIRAVKTVVVILFALLTVHQCRTALGLAGGAPLAVPTILICLAVILAVYYVAAKRAR